MKKLFALLSIFFLTFAPVHANQNSDFCFGFSEGYKSIKGEIAMVPICPLMGIVPIGSTPFREGVRAGMRAALANRF